MLPLRICGDFVRRKVRRKGKRCKRERIGCQQSPLVRPIEMRVSGGDKYMRRGRSINKAPQSCDGHLSLCTMEIFI